MDSTPQEVGYWRAVIDGIRLIPVGEELFFRRLWPGGRLRYKGQPLEAGGISELSARLLCTALRRNRGFFVVIPKGSDSIAPALFASALLLDATARVAAGDRRSSKVSLIGSSVSVRAHLREVSVSGYSLSDAFRQVVLREGPKKLTAIADYGAELSTFLPEVVCALSPSSPGKVVERFRPDWIAVDCDSESVVEWLPELLRVAGQRGIPVIGWISGYIQPVLAAVRASTRPIFAWPLISSRPENRALNADSLLRSRIRARILPLVASGSVSSEVSDSLARATAVLLKIAGAAQGQLFSDCLRAGWRYLRALESLHVPLGFYEAECHAFWGLSTLEARNKAFERFVEATATLLPDLRTDLMEVLRCLSRVHERYLTADPPLWTALVGLVVGSGYGEQARLIVFNGKGKLRLFELALLSIEGIRPNDLEEVQVEITALGQRQANQEIPSDQELSPPPPKNQGTYIVGWPFQSREPELAPFLENSPLQVLILPHQVSRTSRQIHDLSESMLVRVSETDASLRELGIAAPKVPGIAAFRSIEVAESRTISADGGVKDKHGTDPVPIWKAPDAGREANWLLAEDDDADVEASTGLDDSVTESAQEAEVETSGVPDDLITSEAVKADFLDGRSILFSQDTKINVLRGSGQYEALQERSVLNLRPGDRLIFIHGQRRQSIYDLLIARVHDHPSIRLHLALIGAWHDQLKTGFRSWQAAGNGGYDEFLIAIQSLGCQRTSRLTIHFWITGIILCPIDPEDLRRVARVLSMPFVLQHYSRIAKAADRLRGLHRGLANRLNNWLKAQASGIQQASENEIIDEELGLTLSDFKDSLEVLTVRSVTAVHGMYLRSSLNKFVRQ